MSKTQNTPSGPEVIAARPFNSAVSWIGAPQCQLSKTQTWRVSRRPCKAPRPHAERRTSSSRRVRARRHEVKFRALRSACPRRARALAADGRSLSGLTIATLKSQSMAASPSPPMLAAFIVQESNKSIASSRICSPKLHSRNHQENNLQTNPNRMQELPVNSGQSLVDELENQGENKKQEPQKPKNTSSKKFAPPCGFKNQEPQKVAPGGGAVASSLSPREEVGGRGRRRHVSPPDDRS
uniref:Uncharacterized protein n=1 Tax=Oryza glumipatula TaxID=40148 RepID=A0A0D9Y9V8_9ORYZ